MNKDDAERIDAGLAEIEASLQGVIAKTEAFRQEATAKLDAMIATCGRILDDLRCRDRA